MRGPETIYTGYLDRAGALGSLWLGVKQMSGTGQEAPDEVPEDQQMLYTRTGWHFLQVLHVFNTQQVSNHSASHSLTFLKSSSLCDICPDLQALVNGQVFKNLNFSLVGADLLTCRSGLK